MRFKNKSSSNINITTDHFTIITAYRFWTELYIHLLRTEMFDVGLLMMHFSSSLFQVGTIIDHKTSFTVLKTVWMFYYLYLAKCLESLVF